MECDSPEKRNEWSCEKIITLESRFTEFMGRYERDLLEKKEWRLSVDKTLGAINETIRDLKLPYRVGLWVTVVGIGAILVEISRLFIDWIVKHFSRG